MSRRHELAHRYVEFIPKDLEEGVLYISRRFKTASHLCCCGCRQKVATPLNPAKWSLVDHGSTVSLSPSIGLGTLPCRSHYWIRGSRIDWYSEMTDAQTAWAQQADEYDSKVYTGEIRSRPPSLIDQIWAALSSWWTGVVAWFRSLWTQK